MMDHACGLLLLLLVVTREQIINIDKCYTIGSPPRVFRRFTSNLAFDTGFP